MNLVMTEELEFIEVQGTGEESVYSRKDLDGLIELGTSGIRQLLDIHKALLKKF